MMNSRERAQRTVLSLQMACYHAARDYPGGAEALAAHMGMAGNLLCNKLNPNLTTHLLNAHDIELIADLTQDVRIVDALCSLQNRGHFKMPDVDVTGSHIFNKSADMAREFGELMETVSKSLEDNKVNADEVAALDKALMEICASAKELVETAKKFGGVV